MRRWRPTRSRSWGHPDDRPRRPSRRRASTRAQAVAAGVLHRLYHGETHFDFVGKRRIGFAISGVVILVSLLSLFTRGLNLGIEFEGGVAWEFPAANTSVSETRSTLEHYGISDGKIQTLRGADGERIRAQAGPADRRHLERRPPDTRRQRASRHRRGELHVDRPDVGCRDHPQGDTRAHHLLHRAGPVHHGPVRVAHGHRRARRGRARRPHQCRRVFALRVRGHARDRDRVPHDPRLLALRHHRRVRQGAREHPPGARHGPGHVRRRREPEHEPGARSVAQHDAVRRAPRHVAALRRVDPDGRDRAGGLRARTARRPHHRLVLVDLHRHADPGCAQGARASLPSARRPSSAARRCCRRSRPRPRRDARCQLGAGPRRRCDTGRRPRSVASGRRDRRVDRHRARPSSSPAQEESKRCSAGSAPAPSR